MNKPFKKLRGNRVYLIMPQIPESSLYLDQNVKQVLFEKEKEKLDRMKVYAVGDIVTDIEEGDEVFADKKALVNGTLVKLSETLSVICIQSYDIMHVSNKN